MSDGRGWFITLEGIEGAGKTTQTEWLVRALRAAGRQVVATREPGGRGPVAETLRALLKEPAVWKELGLAEIYLYAAARAHHLESLVLPALDEGRDVICDRYLDSTRAYQGFGRGRPRRLIEDLHALPPLDLRPDCTLLLDLPPRVGLARARERGEDGPAGYDDESLAFFERVRDGFRHIAEDEPSRVRMVDADASPLEVHTRIVGALTDLVPGLEPAAGGWP
ncbi:MAG: dTMP kinase [Acidobacteriota bacterium]|nr:dTMP kinase [Acidobacteriota bacterium]MDQ7088090.1 dTMP kinase [Acidobacteriota bacterium]